MKRIHLFFLISTLIVFTTQAQVAEKLTGTIIGTTDCVDYTDFSLSTTVNTAANLFDNDFNTIFATYQRSGGWTGLYLFSNNFQHFSIVAVYHLFVKLSFLKILVFFDIFCKFATQVQHNFSRYGKFLSVYQERLQI